MKPGRTDLPSLNSPGKQNKRHRHVASEYKSQYGHRSSKKYSPNGSPSQMVIEPVIALEIKSGRHKKSKVFHPMSRMSGTSRDESFLPKIASARRS
mmetsp:Transcript_27847/g.42125  ORF Transcript_27847/g.42125 Transcript_27847/m.42125 type:complete len:96 (+) Transcript_27847:3396-3683(+)